MEGKQLIKSWSLGNMADIGITWAGLQLTKIPEDNLFPGSMVNNGDVINYFIIKTGLAAAFVGMYGLASIIDNPKIKWDFVFNKTFKWVNRIIWAGVGYNALQVAQKLL